MNTTTRNSSRWLLALLLVLAVPASAQLTAVRVGGTPPYANPVVGDVNGDGLDDIVGVETASGNGKVYINQGDGSPGVPPTFVATAQNLPAVTFADVGDVVGRLGDIDGDGDRDLFAVPLPYFNDGTGTFTVSTQTPLGGFGGFVPSMDLVDLDSDGDLDAVSFARSTGPYIYENDGTGVFTLVQTITGLYYGGGMFTIAAAVDLDGDPYLDLVVEGSRWARDVYLLLNDGSNNFTVFHQAGVTSCCSGSGAADMDGDGDVDIVAQGRTLFSDGGSPPAFTEVANTAGMLRFAYLYDLDLDGFPDQVVDNKTFFNDGTGLLTATDPIVYGNGTSNRWFDIGDLIGDGIPELVSTYSANGGNIIMFSGIILPPELSVTALIPGAELETVDVDVDLTTNASSVAATAFSIDYDESCLSFDDTDGDADNIPDDLAFNLPAGFAVTAFHDLGDTDGEIDVSIADLAPPIATLADDAILTITFTSTCSPATGATIVAPVGFSSDPAATFSDDLAVDVAGTTADGSVEIWSGPRGDCNSTGALSAADLIADALEIFDGDGTFWADVVGSTYVGSPVGCDANDDTAVDAGDISCTILLIFGGDCGGGARIAYDSKTSPTLSLKGAYEDKQGRLWLQVAFSPGSHGISSTAFSLNLANRGLGFDAFDGDGNGLPDSIRFPAGRPDLVDVRYDARDRRGELDLTIAEFDGALTGGLLLEIAVEPKRGGAWWRKVRFSKAPAATFGDLLGRAVTGRTVNGGRGR